MTSPKHDGRRGHRGKSSVKLHAREHRAILKSPCGRPPITPADLVGEFDRVEGHRHNRLRLRVRWDESGVDTSGFAITLKHYIVEVQYSTDDVNWYESFRVAVPGKFDDDSDEKAHHIFKRGIHPKYSYRFRVRAIASDGCKSAWSDYEDLGSPGEEEPDAPTEVTARRGHHGVLMHWENPEDPDDSDLIEPEVAGYVAELHDSEDFDSLVKKHKLGLHYRTRFHVDFDEGPFYARVRSYSDSKDKSAWIPATRGGNSDPDETPDPIRPLRQRHVFKFTLLGEAEVIAYRPPVRMDDEFRIVKVIGEFDDVPTGDDLVIDILKNGTTIFASPGDALIIADGGSGHGQTTDIDDADLAEDDKLRVSVLQIGSTVPGGDGVIRIICERVA